MTKTINIYPLVAVAVFVAGLFLAYIFGTGQSPILASTSSEASDYQATSTAPVAVFGALTTSNLIRSGQGSLGSVVITGANTGGINIYDATTTNNNLRTVSVSSSSILLASFPPSIAAGTYTLDIGYKRGLLIDVPSGLMPTSTITWR